MYFHTVISEKTYVRVLLVQLVLLVWLANLNTDRKHKSNIRDSILVIRDTLISFHGFVFIFYH